MMENESENTCHLCHNVIRKYQGAQKIGKTLSSELYEIRDNSQTSAQADFTSVHIKCRKKYAKNKSNYGIERNKENNSACHVSSKGKDKENDKNNSDSTQTHKSCARRNAIDLGAYNEISHHSKDALEQKTVCMSKKRQLPNSSGDMQSHEIFEEGEDDNTVRDKMHKDMSVNDNFDFKNCLFCGEEASSAVETKKHIKYRKVVSKLTGEDTTKVTTRAKERNDNLGNAVIARLQMAKNTCQNVFYHRTCRSYFSLHDVSSSDMKRGRPSHKERNLAFQHLCKFMTDNEDSQFSLTQLSEKMQEYTDELICTKSLKTWLMQHFGDQITITNQPGLNAVVFFSSKTDKILHHSWQQEQHAKKQHGPCQKEVIENAAHLLNRDIKTFDANVEQYPAATSLDETIEQTVPATLKQFVNDLVFSHRQQTQAATRQALALQQVIMATCRPRSFVSPLLLAVGVYIHRKHASKDLITLLHNLGFSVSYDEVKKYESSLLVHASKKEDGTDPENVNEIERIIQFAFDNADFNVNTINGHNTFHAMGGIKCTTPAPSVQQKDPVPRLKTRNAGELEGSFGRIAVVTYRKPAPVLPGKQPLVIKSLSTTLPDSMFLARCIDTLWMSAAALGIQPRPSWAGFNQKVTDIEYNSFCLSRVEGLPFINLDPSDRTTIYSALLFAAKEAEKHGKEQCFVTFDQPLYAKAFEIVEARQDELKNVVLRLSGFHLLMSYLGAVGHIMTGSGLEELWGTVYASASVPHMTSGHAYARALRAHEMTQLALVLHVLGSSNVMESMSPERQKDLCDLYRDFLNGAIDRDDLCNNDVVKDLMVMIQDLFNRDKAKSRTDKLWREYFRMVEIIHMFIRAERSGDWALHLHAVREMLPYLHAAGHLAYAKYGHLYVQQMEALSKDTDDNLRFTEEGLFTIRRTDKFWSGLWVDLVIEQVLMRGIKTSGGLTRGRGITESTLLQWISALPLTLPLTNALEDFAGTHHKTSEQHRDLQPSRQSTDKRDVDTFLVWFQTHSPLEERPKNDLVSLSTGLVGDSSVTCDSAHFVGMKLQDDMVGHTFSDVKLKRKEKIVPLAGMRNTVKLKGKQVVVNSQQMLNRALAVLEGSEDLTNVLKHELVPQPPSLFDSTTMRRPAKAALAALFLESGPDRQLPVDPHHVVDGGHLLHAVVWPKPATYNDVSQTYVRFVLQKFGQRTTVVFDGYNTKDSPKSAEQRRRASIHTSANINVKGTLRTTVPQENFLGNSANKSQLIDLVASELVKAGIEVVKAPADADRLIVTTALDKSQSGPVVVDATDTDLLVMLLALAHSNSNIFMYHSSKEPKVFDISHIQKSQTLQTIKPNLLFIHAVTGSDTTSAPYRRGKRMAVNIATKNKSLMKETLVFNNPNADREKIAEVGEKFLLALYGAGKAFSSLDSLRLLQFRRLNRRPRLFQLATLPPTSAAARHHSFRVYLQVQSWMGNDLSPTAWGWIQMNSQLVPVTTDLPSAPNNLLKAIACSCTTGCKGKCGCRKEGMTCSPLCGCVEWSCTNLLHIPETENQQDTHEIASSTPAVP